MANISVNTDSLTNTLNSFVSAHQQLLDTSTSMTAALNACEWQSPQATNFRNAWGEQYQPSLNKLLAAIDEFNGAVRNQLARYNANEGLG